MIRNYDFSIESLKQKKNLKQNMQRRKMLTKVFIIVTGFICLVQGEGKFHGKFEEEKIF